MSIGDRLGLAGLIVAFFGIAAFYLWPDRKWIGWVSLVVAAMLAAAWIFFEVLAHFGADIATLFLCVGIGAIAGGGVGYSIYHSIKSTPTNSKPSKIAAEKEKPESFDERPPTLLDLFLKKEFTNTDRGTGNEPTIISFTDGSAVKIRYQIYMDFPARAKFVGFYIDRPAPPSADTSGNKTFVVCMKLLETDAVYQAFDAISKKVVVVGGGAHK